MRVQIIYPVSARTRDRRRVHGRTGVVIFGGHHTALVELDDHHRICVPHANLIEIREKP